MNRGDIFSDRVLTASLCETVKVIIYINVEEGNEEENIKDALITILEPELTL